MGRGKKPSRQEIMDALAFMAAAYDKKVDCEKIFSDREKENN